MSRLKYESLLKEKELKILQLKETKRIQLLEKYHLYEEVQGPKSDEFPHYKWDKDQAVYYKKVYEDVSDEELKELEVLFDKEETLNEKVQGDFIDETKPVEFTATTVFGFIFIILGLFTGVIFLREYGVLGFANVVEGLSIGIAFLTAAHIIRQLNIVINNLNKDK